MKIYDISLALTPRLPRWPGDPDIVLTPYQSLAAGDNSNNTHLACSVHTGTHIDAPAHFIDNGAGVEQKGSGARASFTQPPETAARWGDEGSDNPHN